MNAEKTGTGGRISCVLQRSSDTEVRPLPHIIYNTIHLSSLLERYNKAMDYNLLETTNLFSGLSTGEIRTLLACLGSREVRFAKDAVIFRGGDVVTEVGLILDGSVNVIAYHYWGGSSIFGHAEKGHLFGEAYAAIPGKELLCDVKAAEDSHILFMNWERLVTTCGKNCDAHRRIIRNLLSISASNTLAQITRMMHTAPRTIRERLLSYLSEQAAMNGSPSFRIPFSRQQLADYLGVDRSALSNELSKMQKEGLISFRKNEFQLRSR